MYYSNKERKEKKKIYGTRKFKKRLVSCALGVIFAIGAASIPAVFQIGNNVVNAGYVIDDGKKWEKYYLYESWGRLFTTSDENVPKSVNLIIENTNNPKEYDVTIEYNNEGVYDSGNYIQTSNPWFSYAISGGFDIVSNKTFEVIKEVGGSLTFVKEKMEANRGGISGPLVEGTVNTTTARNYWSEGSVNFTQAAKLSEYKIDMNNLSFYDTWMLDVGGEAGYKAKVKVKFRIRKNDKFSATKDYIVAHYKSWDHSNVYKSTSIWKDNSDVKDVPVYASYTKTSGNETPTLPIDQDITIKYTTLKGKSGEFVISSNKDNYESKITADFYKDTWDVITNTKMFIGNVEIPAGGRRTVGYNGKDYDISFNFNVEYDANQNVKNYKFDYKKIEHVPSKAGINLISIDFVEGIENKPTGIKKLYKVGEIISNNLMPTIELRELGADGNPVKDKNGSEKPITTRYIGGGSYNNLMSGMAVTIRYADGRELGSPIRLGDKIYVTAWNKAQNNPSNVVENLKELNVVDISELEKVIAEVEIIKNTDNYNNSSAEIKEKLISTLENAKKIVSNVNNFNDNIVDIPTQSKIIEAQKALLDAVSNLDGDRLALDKAKEAANKAIDEAAKAKKEEIAQSGLSEEDKKTANDAVDAEVQKAKEAISAATDKAGVESAKTDGTGAINKVQATDTLNPAKEAANKAIDEAAKAKKEEIAQSGLSEEDKKTANDAVDAEVQKAKDAISAATDTTGVDGAKKAGVEAINGVKATDTLTPAKEALESEVAKKDDVKSSNNYQNSDEDNKKAYDDALAKAEEVLNNSNATKEDLDNARKALEEAREALNGSDNKTELGAPTFTDSLPAFTGFDELNKAAEDKINEVNNSNLTDAEKEALKQIINNILKEAVNSILNTKNAQEAEKLKDNALNKLLSIVVGKSNIDNKDNKKKDIVTNKLPNTGVDSSNLFGILGVAGIFAAALKRKKEDEE